MLEADGVDHHVLVSSADRAVKFAEGNRVFPERLVVTNNGEGLGNSRNAALDMMEEGEWALFLVDDMKQCYELDTYSQESSDELPIDFDNQNEYRRRLRTPISTKEFLERATDSIPHLESVGSALLGFAPFSNPMFRRKKWGYQVLADGRAWLVKKTDLRFDPRAEMMDDYFFTALNIREFGVSVIDRWIEPKFARYTAGGYGTIDERMARKIQTAQFLVEEFPDLIQHKQKKGWPDGSHIGLRGGLQKKYPIRGQG
jgi:hypothetical protein